MTKRILTTALIITLMSYITSCGSNDQKYKLYYAIYNNNLQGLIEVLADDPGFDFDKLDRQLSGKMITERLPLRLTV